jgi:GH25 family lysozyme M1 (1,4-beta-N-acetylmuramidase)
LLCPASRGIVSPSSPPVAAPSRERPTHLELLELVVFVPALRHASRGLPPRPFARVAGIVLAGVVLLAPAAPVALAATARPQPAATASGEAVATQLEGIDVSHWQNTIDWTKVAAAGKRFAFIKATDSTDYLDPKYAYNHATAKANGIWTGAYHFARPDATAGDAIKEADWFAAHIGLGSGDLVPALDLEQAGGLSVAALQSWVKTFVGEVQARTGVRPMIYTSPAFWKKYMGDTQSLADLGYKTLWVAHWGVSAPTVPANNWGGKGWTFWQYSNCGTVPGISGCVDLDRYHWTDFSSVAYSTFKLTASLPAGSVKQGGSSAATVGILRTNFASNVQLNVAGLPAGVSASFDANPVGDAAAAMSISVAPDEAAPATGTYPLTISGVADGLTRTTKLNLVISDGIAPTLSAPSTRLWSGRVLGTSTVPVRVSWGASDPSGVASTGLQRSANGGSWTTTALPSTAATAADSSIPIGGTARQRVRATDKKANTSDWLNGDLVRASVYQQSSSAITWTGTWHTTGWSGASGGSVRYATTKGATATFRFSGTSVAWVAAKGSTRGSVWVYVDDAYAGSVSLYSKTGQSRAIVFARNWTTVGTHTIRIVVAGTAGHSRVDVDGFVRLTTG